MVEIVEMPKIKKWKVKCEHCGCTLKFSRDDVLIKKGTDVAWSGTRRIVTEYILCPNCHMDATTKYTVFDEFVGEWSNDYRSEPFEE